MRYLRIWLSMLALCVFATHPAEAAFNQAAIGPGDKVTITFNLTVPETHFGIKDNVSEYVPGQRQLLPALEQALMGMKAGDRKHVEFKPEEGFGTYDPGKRRTVARDQLPKEAKVGDVYESAHGQPFMVESLSDQNAVVDFNHPLAGKLVVFDVQVLKVERAAETGIDSNQSGSPGTTITTFTGATVENVDQDSQKLRFRTQEGQNWSLAVTDSELLQGLKEGDRVSLEVNSDDRVKNIIKKEKN